MLRTSNFLDHLSVNNHTATPRISVSEVTPRAKQMLTEHALLVPAVHKETIYSTETMQLLAQSLFQNTFSSLIIPVDDHCKQML